MAQGVEHLPFMLYADSQGRIFEHPYLRMAGFSAAGPIPIDQGDLVPLPRFSKLFYLPQCPPMGLEPKTGALRIVNEMRHGRRSFPCHAVGAFLEPGWVRTHLPAADYRQNDYLLPLWAYTAVGFRDGGYWACAFQVEHNPRWDPANYDDRLLPEAIERFIREEGESRLLRHLVRCATENHCFAAKNLFLRRWEAPMPVSRACNAACLGCLSHQPRGSCQASHQRISFRPEEEVVVGLATAHLKAAGKGAIVSFGQGCEGEPLTEWRLIERALLGIRRRIGSGTLNMNSNGSHPDRVRRLAEAGLDSIRISLNSARPELYTAYYRPRDYRYQDVVTSLKTARDKGLYTMINYLVFPGVTDQPAELEALEGLLRETDVQFIHLKNLCIDPRLYGERMAEALGRKGFATPGIGLRRLMKLVGEAFPSVEFGYFNRPVRD